MWNYLLPLVGVAKSVADIFRGKADAEDIDNIIDVAGDIIEDVLPKMAAVLPYMELAKPAIMAILSEQNPLISKQFEDDFNSLNAALSKLSPKVEALSDKLGGMNVEEFNALMDRTGY